MKKEIVAKKIRKVIPKFISSAYGALKLESTGDLNPTNDLANT